MKVLAITVFVVFIGAVNALGQSPCTEYTTPKSVMAFCPPADWPAGTKEAGENHPTFIKKVAESEFSPALIVQEDKVEGPVELMAFGIVQSIFDPKKPTDKSINDRITGVSDFKTTSGLKGIRIVSESTEDPFELHYVWYVLDGPGNVKLTFTYISTVGDTSDARLAEAAVMTVRIKKVSH